MVGSLWIGTAFHHSHLAFAAGAPPATCRIDGQADPVGGAEERRAGRDARSPLEGEVPDLELALDHVLVAWAACSARKLAIHLMAYSSWPSRRSPARTARRTSGTSGLVMAHVSPAFIARGRKAAFTVARSGSPKETLDAPHVMLLPSRSRTSRIVSSVMTPHVGSAATVIAIGSMMMSSCGMP